VAEALIFMAEMLRYRFVLKESTRLNATGGSKWLGVAPGPVYEAWRHPRRVSEYVERSRFGLHTGAGRDID
jgi:hypothetical protein